MFLLCYAKHYAFMIRKGYNMEEVEKWETQFKKGLIEALVMKAVIHQEKSYGYQLLVFLTEQGLDITEGTLYPLLNRMEKNGWLSSNWDMPENGGHPKRVYQPSVSSKANLSTIFTRIDHYVDVYNKLKGL